MLEINVDIPSNWNLDHANLTFSDLNYQEYYVSNDSYDLYDMYHESQNHIEPNVTTSNQTGLIFPYSTPGNYSDLHNLGSGFGWKVDNGSYDCNSNLYEFKQDTHQATNLTSYSRDNYPGTFSFYEDDISGDIVPKGWTRTSHRSRITAERTGAGIKHKKVFELPDSSGSLASICYQEFTDDCDPSVNS